MAVALTANADWDAGFTSDTTHVYASGMTLVSGRTIAFFASWKDETVTATVTDTFGNTYTLVDDITETSNTDGTRRARTFYAKNITGGANYTPTVTYSGATLNRVLGFREMSGADATTPLVGHVANPQTLPGHGTDAITSTAMTPTAANAMVISFVSGSIRRYLTIGTGWGNEALGFGPSASNSIDWVRSGAILQTTAVSVAGLFTQALGDDPITTLTFTMAFQPPGVGGVTDGWKILLH